MSRPKRKALAWAVAKAVWPFIAGAVSGGLASVY